MRQLKNLIGTVCCLAVEGRQADAPAHRVHLGFAGCRHGEVLLER